MNRLFLAVLLFIISSLLQADNLEVIPLRHQSAEDLIPVIRPLIEGNGVITGSGYKLIVRASSRQISEIKKLLQQLDQPVQQLIVSVRQNQQKSGQFSRQGISGNIGNNRNQINFGNPQRSNGLSARYTKGDDQIQVHTNQRNASLENNISQQVRTLSGQPAYITIGESRPIPQRQTIVRGNQIIQTDVIQHHNTATGFYVTPRVHGDQVTLEISTQHQRPAGNSIDTASLATRINGKLGEWIQLGSTDNHTSRDGSSFFAQQNRQSHDISNVAVMITIAH